MPITRIGISRPNTSIRSNRLWPTSGSRQSTAYARIFGSSAMIRRGVKIFLSRLRCSVWIGGSSMIRVPGGSSMPDLMISRMLPRALEKRTGSFRAHSTSSARLTAKKSCFSL